MQFIQKKNRRQIKQHMFVRKPMVDTNNKSVVEVVEEKPVVTKKEKKVVTKVEKSVNNNVIEENLEQS